ncbi:hypothetical protein MD484_g3871, partial [Candolleomyces efflorescens]
MSTNPTDDEKTQFANAALEQLNDPTMVQKFQDNVKQVGTWANEVDAAFGNVTRKFATMVETYGKDFPDFVKFNSEWRWVTLLTTSRDVASQHAAVLRRFDSVFLTMIQMIGNDNDRQELLRFYAKAEDHDASIDMSSGFLNLKRDVADFVVRLDEWIQNTGATLADEAKQLKLDIDGLTQDISVLDGKIEDATKALAICGACLNLIGVIVAGSVLASFKAQRDEKDSQLQAKKTSLTDVNRRQTALANLQSDFDGVKPDITLICARLVLFSEIWASVRSQTVEFQSILKGGMNAVTNMGFKAQVNLAKATCDPLADGLEKYATELENRTTN